MYRKMSALFSSADSLKSQTITAYTNLEKSNYSITQPVIVNMEGIENKYDKEIETVPALSGGFYVVSERTPMAEFSFEINYASGFNTIYKNIRDIYLAGGSFPNIPIYEYEDFTTTVVNSVNIVQPILKSIEAINVNTIQDRGNIKFSFYVDSNKVQYS